MLEKIAKKEIVMIDIDDLGIDRMNIRGGEWDYDEELIESVKEQGILEPLLVRPAKDETGVKYAIISGSRRYNAAIEAGLTEVPCIIVDVDDVTAIGLSIIENRHRKDIPRWRYIEKIGEMYERLNHTQKKDKVVEKIAGLTGISKPTIYKYLEIYGLPSEIRELIKEPEERSVEVTELLKSISDELVSKTLDIEKAYAIASYTRGKISIDKKLELALFVMERNISVEEIKPLAESIVMYPEKPVHELYERVQEIPKLIAWRITFDSLLARAITEACLRKQIEKEKLIVEYVRDGLKRDGFL
ncbi:TPA: ParB/RepB/Spo0J family partition protein [Candidatus Bathyarchaeota archaeon]|nr:ParB/RepB/Spo0J family partition protein [Candidatus Bathyarchaeota archaeon]